MSYPAITDRRIPYDNDGAVMGVGDTVSGITSYPTSSQVLYAQGLNAVAGAYSTSGVSWTKNGTGVHKGMAWLFFPERREVTGIFCAAGAKYGAVDPSVFGVNAAGTIEAIEGSDDTTNGMDGSWELASLPSGAPAWVDSFSWRSGIKSVSFTGGKRAIRIRFGMGDPNYAVTYYMPTLHLYGEKVAGQTPDDLLFIDHDTTPGVEYAADEDFGDRPLGTSVIRQFRVKNVSPTLTANTITLQCNDADFAISENGTTWVTTINISSLGPGVESATLYVRNTTPDPGALLGPRFARIVATAGSWT